MAKHECEEALDRLFEYIDGELTAAELEQVSTHLKECPPCEAEHKLNEKIKTRVAATGGECAPENLRTRILETLRTARES
jgi:mycothiol system anti-sigma-R factor